MNQRLFARRQFCQMLGVGLIGVTSPTCKGFAPQAAPVDDGQPIANGRILLKPWVRIGTVSPYLFGSAIEWTDHGNGLYDPSRGGLRQDVIALLKPLRVPVWRFPGGILSDYYHWRDGIGPQSRRPARRNPMDNTEHANTFGTDEFIAFLRGVGGEPLITANVGTGTYEEVDGWRRHFAASGLPVKLWELGNEIYLAEPKAHATIPGNDERIYRTPSAYAALAADWSRRLHDAESGVLVGGIAGTYNTSRENRDWISILLRDAGSELDFVALHNAFAPLIFGRYDYTDPANRQAAYRAMSAQTSVSASDSTDVMSRWRAVRGQEPVRIAITEHFPLFGGGGDVQPILDQSRTMAGALFTAGLFHAWMRAGVWLATYNLTFSRWFGALLTDTNEGLIKTPTYHVFDLYRNHFGTTLIEVATSGPTFSSAAVGTVPARQDIPYLDVVAARDDHGLAVSVLCRRFAGMVKATIEGLPPGAVAVTTLAADVPNAINGPGLTSTTRSHAGITPRMSRWNYHPDQMYEFPANSITVLRWDTV